jgi:serine phosphatase RsbU (regulator of sigma subunit)
MHSLTILTGESPGKVFRLTKDETVIGKGAECDIVLPDRYVSKAHARIVRRPDGLYIENLKNRNQTKVSGVLLTEPRRLAHGDLIKICDYTLTYAGAGTPPGGTTVILGTVDLTKATNRTLFHGAVEAKLRVLMEIGAELVGILDLPAVLDKVLDLLFRAFPHAERGFVLSRGELNNPVTIRARKLRSADADDAMPSRTVYDLVTGERQAILCEDVHADLRFSGSRSVGASCVHSIMCAPLWGAERTPVGVIQVDTTDRRNRYKQEDLDFLVAIAGTISMVIENARLHEIEVRHRQTEQEARDAWAVQRTFIPDRCPDVPGYELWHHYQPARFVGGDYLDYLPLRGAGASASKLPATRWAIALGDVSGKGMPAALLMARIATEVRLLFQEQRDPTRVLGLLNRGLYENEAAGRFVTLLLLLLDAKRHQLTFVNAGHMPPMMRRAGGRIEVIGHDRAAPPLGVVEHPALEAVTVQIGSGDVVLLYTDGVNEAMSPGGEQFGIQRLEKCVAAASRRVSSVGQAIADAVGAHTGKRDQFDDVALICLGRS